jgi:hypothetical protein
VVVGWRKALPVISDCHHKAIVAIGEHNIDMACLGVAADVAPGLLDDPKERELALWRQASLFALDDQIYLGRALTTPLEQELNRWEEAKLLKRRRAQVANNDTQLAHQIINAASDCLEPLLCLRVIATLNQALHTIDAMAKRNQLLDNLIVELAGKPAPLGLLRRAQRSNIGVLVLQALLCVRPQDIDRPTEILKRRDVTCCLAKLTKLAPSHSLGPLLEGAEELLIDHNLAHIVSSTRSG